jgi:hypothetical protein
LNNRFYPLRVDALKASHFGDLHIVLLHNVEVQRFAQERPKFLRELLKETFDE